MLQRKVLIIGAGAAGIAAASKLVSNNICNITVLEAEERIGGRIHTSYFENGIIELGAQWVHGELNNVTHSLGSAVGLLDNNSYNITKSASILSDGTFLEDDIAFQLYNLCKETLQDEDKLLNFKGSLGDYFSSRLSEKMKMSKIHIDPNILQSFVNWFHRFQNSIDGSDSWFQTSAQGTLEYHECEGNLLTRWKNGGYVNIFDILMGNNSNLIKEKIVFNKKVQSISWSNQPLEVLCTDGETFIADHVIVTVSLGVLKENIINMFIPPVPQKKLSAVQGLGIGTVNKIFIKFPYRWWPVDCTGFSLLWRKNYLNNCEKEPTWMSEVFGFYSVDSNPLVLCGWLVGPAARNMEQSTDQQVKDGCHRLLMKFLGNHYNIPPPDSLLRSRWHSNPHFRGSYSFRSILSDKLNVTAADLASPLCQLSGYPVVLFAGEATHDHFYSTVHGAIETGWREADRLISLYSNSWKRLQEKTSDQNEVFSVIIIGAGMAGLGAAKTLQEAGICNFIIIEAQDQPGGRVCSVPLNDLSENYIELGAQWIHGEDNPVFKLAEQEKLLSNITSVEGQGLHLKPNGEAIPVACVQEVARVVGDILESCCQFVNKADAPDSIGNFLTEQFTHYLNSCNDPFDVRKDKKDLFDWHIRFQMIDNSCDQLNCLSARAWGLYQFTGGTEYNNFKHGYSSLVEFLARNLPVKSLKTGLEVKKITYNSTHPMAKVLCEGGREYLAEHVIVTSSLGYLKQNHHTLFNPPLPYDITMAISHMGFDTINKLFLVYDSAWWPDDFQGIQLIWDSEEKMDPYHQSWLRNISGFDVLANMNGVLLGWVGGKGAVTMETSTDEEIAKDCTHIFRKFMHRPDIPIPKKIFRSKWYSNKFVRGGYSHTTIQCDKKGWGPDTLTQPIYLSTSDNDIKHPVVLLAGEAVHRSYFSTTHGAYISGVSQAQVIINYLKQSSKI